MAFLEIENLHKSYGGNAVLRGIDLSVNQHEVLCLIGASGSGKSTLLRCINALETIDEGEIRLDGDGISGPGVDVNKLREHIGIVFQNFNLFPNMTVLRNIAVAPEMLLGLSRDQANERALGLLERIGLADKANAHPDQLSGGQQQRAAIVRSLAMEPRMLLLDEITSALDPELVSEVLSLVRELAGDGMTMLLATHEMNFAREVSNRVCFLHQGTICEIGTPEQIFTAPEHPRTQEFLRSIIAAGRL
ncbi:amino acid ABC transporter ATP-binding protein [Arthrobacter burdickii]|uniref:Amino acid ABC transporter ATP-binding protein n=1 Tax=Arthrobacter burdickii TaxID=3035920 RepID=A0ABT8JWU3_9MICC|nr:amino acid ABC transporter ATP-binding protein [Arthrobacter burdickii]MDN4609630.1 amino acid ABC transporter ATP-binding protein [Arthrobacter burdickii]